ncbi:g11678 [Coccomyxa elongata]
MELRIEGFDNHVQSMGLKRLPRKVKYDLEPQPSSLTPSERLQEGLRAFFLENPGIEQASERLKQQDIPDSVPLTAVHVGCNQPAAVSKPGSESWTACAGLVLSQDAQNTALLGESDTGHTGVQLLLFENYGHLHRHQDSILKAIERVNWIEYNLPLEGMLKQADGSVVLKFASAADHICKEFQVLVVHLVSAADISFKRPRKRTCPPGLSIQLEAKLVKNAVEDVLLSIKKSRPLTMMSPFEQRMACLSHISRSITGIVSSSDNSIFQDEALQVADSSLEDLPNKIQAYILPFLPDPACLEEIALNVIAAAAEKAPVGGLQRSDADANGA